MFLLNKKAKAGFSMLAMVVFACACVSAKPKKSNLVKQEPGFYYGIGTGGSNDEAKAKAKRALVIDALTSTIRQRNPSADDVTVSEEVVELRTSELKPYEVSKDGLKVVYRIKAADWDKTEKKYAEALRKTLDDSYRVLSGNASSAKKLESASKILSVLAENGETDNLSIQDGSSDLYSEVTARHAKNVINDLSIAVTTENGFLNAGKKVSVSVKDGGGNAVGGLKLKAVWAAADLPITIVKDELPESVSFITTDASGEAVVEFPVADEYKNRLLSLSISTSIASGDFVTSAMRKLDNGSAIEARFCYDEDIEDFLRTIKVEAGTYKNGALAHDSKAMRHRETSRDVTVESYAVGQTPVTNFQFAAYLYLSGEGDNPEYLDNSDYNQENQPVVAVTHAQAEAFAAWLSNQTGKTYRLPTDDEWEVAARSGRECIFPWGDESPAKNKNANFKGNGKVKGPSAIGSFVEGNSAWGLEDMAGNVWEWTTSVRNDESNDQMRTVKGGSWMDGPNDLRISNYKNINKDSSLADVGFRVVLELK